MDLPTISVIQPWPWLLLRPDVEEAAARTALRASGLIKDHENRSWATPVRGWVLLQASATRLAQWDYRSASLFATKRGVEVPIRDNLPYGAIVGAIRIDDCVSRSASPWFTGPFGFAIGHALPFAQPIPCRGALKFFPVPHCASLDAQIRAAGLARAFRIDPAL